MAAVERNLAVLFADVSGSTKLYERLGDTEAMRAVDRVIKRMERAIEGFQGRLVKTLGDEVMASFETAEQACMAAIEMQQRVADLPAVSGVKLVVRLGFHFGLVSEENGDLFGDTVNTAARIVGMANSEQILISRQALELLSPLLRDATRSCNQSSGKAESVEVFEVLWRAGDEPASKREVERETEPEADEVLAPPVAAKVSQRLCLRYRGKSFLLDDKSTLLTLGRERGNDLIIEDPKASRRHARIQRRGDQYFLSDQSTNGTYVSPKGAKEQLLRRTEMVLSGSGVICFGSSVNEPQADSAEYEFL